MKLSQSKESAAGPATIREHFHGPVAQELVHEYSDPRAVRVLIVRFEPGARCHWHRHEGGQVLHVVQGEGRVQAWGEEVRTIRTGDMVVAAPGEKHWHGAGPSTSMAHLAVSLGKINWLEESADAKGD